MYYVTNVLFCQKSKIHIPYFVGMVVVGPRGGRYLFDVFNSTKMVLHIKNWYVLHDRMDAIMSEIGHNMGVYTTINIGYDGEEDLYNQLANMYDIKKKFIRKNVNEAEIQNIIKNIHR